MYKLLTILEVSKFTRLSKATIYSYVSTGKIPNLKIGSKVLFNLEKIEEWLKGKERDVICE